MLIVALLFHGWAMTVGWTARNLPGVEYRQAQTALSAYFIKEAGTFELAYPTPVLGKPWSIPMEFPLYQWTVVTVHHVTGLGLVKSARAVSMACFYLMLPAVFLLLGNWRLPMAHRGVVLALLISSPFYLFYSRAFLIETMALMFAVWFWVAFERGVGRRRWGWVVVALATGMGAALVKVTTLMVYLLPVGLWSVRHVWREGNFKYRIRDIVSMICILLPMAGVTAWWIRKADAIKSLNPVADFLGSVHMSDFNIGNTALRLSPELWTMKVRIIGNELLGWPMLWIFAGLILFGFRQHRWIGLTCLVGFIAPLVLFPVLYAYHAYYFVANLLFVQLAAGVMVAGGLRSRRQLAMLLAIALFVGQGLWYVIHYYPIQRGAPEGGDELSRLVQRVTGADDVIIVTGRDWNSMLAYYARRRALMLRGDAEADVEKLHRAFTNLKDEAVGVAVIAAEEWRTKSALLDELKQRGFADRPLLVAEGAWLFFPVEKEPWVNDQMRRGHLGRAEWAPGAMPDPPALAGDWHRLDELPLDQRKRFASMRPLPIRFFSTFEPVVQVLVREPAMSCHPLTRLIFELPEGQRELRCEMWFNPDAYQGPLETSDGVEVQIFDTTGRVLAARHIDPANRPEDRGLVKLTMPFELPESGEVEVSFGPGPAGRDTRDWIWLRGGLTIE
ncbi:MAG: hypothetical protein R3F03_15250 [Opitutaceae bacterium]